MSPEESAELAKKYAGKSGKTFQSVKEAPKPEISLEDRAKLANQALAKTEFLSQEAYFIPDKINEYGRRDAGPGEIELYDPDTRIAVARVAREPKTQGTRPTIWQSSNYNPDLEYNQVNKGNFLSLVDPTTGREVARMANPSGGADDDTPRTDNPGTPTAGGTGGGGTPPPELPAPPSPEDEEQRDRAARAALKKEIDDYMRIRNMEADDLAMKVSTYKRRLKIATDTDDQEAKATILTEMMPYENEYNQRLNEIAPESFIETVQELVEAKIVAERGGVSDTEFIELRERQLKNRNNRYNDDPMHQDLISDYYANELRNARTQTQEPIAAAEGGGPPENPYVNSTYSEIEDLLATKVADAELFTQRLNNPALHTDTVIRDSEKNAHEISLLIQERDQLLASQVVANALPSLTDLLAQERAYVLTTGEELSTATTDPEKRLLEQIELFKTSQISDEPRLAGVLNKYYQLQKNKFMNEPEINTAIQRRRGEIEEERRATQRASNERPTINESEGEIDPGGYVSLQQERDQIQDELDRKVALRATNPVNSLQLDQSISELTANISALKSAQVDLIASVEGVPAIIAEIDALIDTEIAYITSQNKRLDRGGVAEKEIAQKLEAYLQSENTRTQNYFSDPRLARMIQERYRSKIKSELSGANQKFRHHSLLSTVEAPPPEHENIQETLKFPHLEILTAERPDEEIEQLIVEYETTFSDQSKKLLEDILGEISQIKSVRGTLKNRFNAPLLESMSSLIKARLLLHSAAEAADYRAQTIELADWKKSTDAFFGARGHFLSVVLGNKLGIEGTAREKQNVPGLTEAFSILQTATATGKRGTPPEDYVMNYFQFGTSDENITDADAKFSDYIALEVYSKQFSELTEVEQRQVSTALRLSERLLRISAVGAVLNGPISKAGTRNLAARRVNIPLYDTQEVGTLNNAINTGENPATDNVEVLPSAWDEIYKRDDLLGTLVHGSDEGKLGSLVDNRRGVETFQQLLFLPAYLSDRNQGIKELRHLANLRMKDLFSHFAQTLKEAPQDPNGTFALEQLLRALKTSEGGKQVGIWTKSFVEGNTNKDAFYKGAQGTSDGGGLIFKPITQEEAKKISKAAGEYNATREARDKTNYDLIKARNAYIDTVEASVSKVIDKIKTAYPPVLLVKNLFYIEQELYEFYSNHELTSRYYKFEDPETGEEIPWRPADYFKMSFRRAFMKDPVFSEINDVNLQTYKKERQAEYDINVFNKKTQLQNPRSIGSNLVKGLSSAISGIKFRV